MPCKILTPFLGDTLYKFSNQIIIHRTLLTKKKLLSSRYLNLKGDIFRLPVTPCLAVQRDVSQLLVVGTVSLSVSTTYVVLC